MKWELKVKAKDAEKSPKDPSSKPFNCERMVWVSFDDDTQVEGGIEIRARSRLTDWCLLAFSPQFTPFEVGKNFFNPSITDSSHFRFSFLATLGTLGANPIGDRYFDHPLYLKTHNYGFWKGFGEIFFFLYSKLLVMFVCKVFQNICKSHLPQNVDWQIMYWDKIEEGNGLFSQRIPDSSC